MISLWDFFQFFKVWRIFQINRLFFNLTDWILNWGILFQCFNRLKYVTQLDYFSIENVEPLIVDNQTLEVVNTIKLLGVYLTSDLKWTTHVRHISSKASKRLYALRILKRNGVQPSYLKQNACPVWHTSLPKFLIDELEHIQKRALKIIVPHLSYSESLIDLALRREGNCYADPFIKTIIVTLPVKFLVYCLNLWIISTDLDIPDLFRFLMHELNATMIVFYLIAYANGTLFEFLNSYS